MITTLGIENTDSLSIFDEFVVDKSLPRYKATAKPKEKIQISKDNDGAYIPISAVDEYEDPVRWAEAVQLSREFAEENDSLFRNRGIMINPRAGNSFWNLLKSFFKEQKEKLEAVSVQETFNGILMSAEELKELNGVNEKIDAMVNKAEKLGQKDLLKILKDRKKQYSFECVLYAKGRKKYLTEKQLLSFGKKCEKGLCLDYIKYYTRPIPDEVFEEKVKCDEDMLFDNYVILHFDPKNKATTEKARKEEIAKRRDPIMFGVIKESRNLYFVADWKDELCDLTLDKIIDTLGESLEFDPKSLEAVK